MPEYHHGANRWHALALALIVATLMGALALGGWRFGDLLFFIHGYAP